MKTITFFSEKGGVGKSSFAIMYASWLHYKYGVKVGIADFNLRIEGYRNAEIRKNKKMMKDNPDVKPYDTDNAWPIITCSPREIYEINNKENNVNLNPHATWLKRQIYAGPLDGYDVVILDFPGNLTGKEFLNIRAAGMIDLVIIPTEKDEMTLQSTSRLHRLLDDETNRTNHCVFINKAQLNLRNLRAAYLKLGEILIRKGMPLLPDMISFSERITNMEKTDNIRSTFGFPDFGLPEYGPSRDLGIENLFIDVTRELKNTCDITDTPETDLSFVDGLTKIDDGRQLKGTPYPEYEI